MAGPSAPARSAGRRPSGWVVVAAALLGLALGAGCPSATADGAIA
ncbi:MAG: anti-sigma factor, partial [Deltaproteobacteria bacterium HGW-Deltaproteobacteria-14]